MILYNNCEEIKMRNDLISYNGAYLYQLTDGTWEANLYGFHYSAPTIDELKAKVDKYKGSAYDSFKTATSKTYAAPVYGSENNLFEDADDGEEIVWAAVYYLPAKSSDIDDDFENKNEVTVDIVASDFESASKYAQQYIIKMLKGEDAHEWQNAEILSLERK